MARQVLVALTNAADGRDDEFNDWYNNQHLGDVLQIPGFVSAQRFKLGAAQRMASPPYKYLTLYEIETDNIQETMSALSARSGTALMPISDTLHADRLAAVFEPMAPPVLRKQ